MLFNDRNVPYEATDEDLKEIFGKFGQLEVCKVVIDKDTEHSKGKGIENSIAVHHQVKSFLCCNIANCKSHTPLMAA